MRHGPTVRADDDHLAAPTTDVDDREVGPWLATMRHADQRQQGFLVVRQDLGDAGCRANLVRRLSGVLRPTQWLGGHEGDGVSAQVSRDAGEACQGRGELLAFRRAEATVGIDGGAQTEECRLVVDRFESVTADDRDEEVDRIRARIGGRSDMGLRSGHPPRPGPRRGARVRGPTTVQLRSTRCHGGFSECSLETPRLGLRLPETDRAALDIVSRRREGCFEAGRPTRGLRRRLDLGGVGTGA